MGSLRFLLAIAVIIAHSTPIFGIKMIGGTLAVQSFFIISGFYMSLILNEKYVNKRNSYKLFIINRFLRLYPLYWFILLLTVGLFIFPLLRDGNDGIVQLYIQKFQQGFLEIRTSVFLILSNLFLIGQDLTLFFVIDIDTKQLEFTPSVITNAFPLWTFLFVPQAWTLGLEVLFYLIAPFVVRRKIFSILILLILSLLLRFFILSRGLNYDPWTERFFPTELALFLIGRIAYEFYKRLELTSYKLLFYITLVIIYLYILFYQFIPTNEIKFYGFFILVFLSIPLLFNFTKTNKIDRYLGELSYPIYISHMLLLYIIETRRFLWIESLGTTLAIGTIFFSISCYHLIVAPIERIREKRLIKASVGTHN